MRFAGIATVALLLVLMASGSPPGAAQAANHPVVCLDPGHGGSEPGAVNGALEEKDINLDVAYAVRSQLTAAGYGVVMTRTGDQARSSNDRYAFCNAQQATILVSIHTNSSPSAAADGTLAIYFHEDDRVLAAAIQPAVYQALLPGAPVANDFTDRGLKRDALGVLLKSNMPAATIEPLFMSHTGEAGLLAQPIHVVDGSGVVTLTGGEPTANAGCTDGCRRQEIAGGIAEGILAYLQAAPPPPGDDGGGGGNGGCGSPPCRKR